MDWPRARAILLVSFTVLNVVLILFLWVPGVGAWGALQPNSPEHMREVQARLKEVGAELRAPLPEAGSVVPLLRVSRTLAPVANLGPITGHPAWLSEGERTSAWQPGMITPRDGHAWMAPQLEADGTADYPLYALGQAGRPLDLNDESRTQTTVAQVLTDIGLLPAGAKYRRTYHTDRGLAVEFTQMATAAPLFSGQVTAYVSSRGVEDVHYFWVSIDSARGERKNVIPPSQALLLVAGQLGGQTGQEHAVFTRIEMGYSGTHPADAQSWDVVPVWRIDLQSGASYYVDGFTGIVGDKLIP